MDGATVAVAEGWPLRNLGVFCISAVRLPAGFTAEDAEIAEEALRIRWFCCISLKE